MRGERTFERPISRRAFIQAVIAGGATASATSYVFRGSSTLVGQSATSGRVERLITLQVNGQQRRVDVLPHETLAITLRYRLGLTGTKLGCDRAECGACTVLIAGLPHYSCSILTHSVRSRAIMTIEGLARDQELHPIQRAIVEEQAFQCAFCLPGFVMSAVGYLNTHPSPTRGELAHGISGNLCRCGDYNKILNAMMRGAEHLHNGSI